MRQEKTKNANACCIQHPTAAVKTFTIFPEPQSIVDALNISSEINNSQFPSMSFIFILLSLVSLFTPFSGFQPITLTSVSSDSDICFARRQQVEIFRRWRKINNHNLGTSRHYSSGKISSRCYTTRTSLFGHQQTSINAIKTFVSKRFRLVSQKIITKWRHHRRPFALESSSLQVLDEECTTTNTVITIPPLLKIVTQRITKKFSQHRSLYPPWVSNVSFLQGLLEQEEDDDDDRFKKNHPNRIMMVQDFEYAPNGEDDSGLYSAVSRQMSTEHIKSFGSHIQGITTLNNETLLLVEKNSHHSIRLVQDATAEIVPLSTLEQHTVVSSYMRVSDLDLEGSSFFSVPAGVKPDSSERWAQLAAGSNEVHQVLVALENAGLDAISNERLWEAEKLTERHLERKRSIKLEKDPAVMDHEGMPQDTLVLLWNGKFYNSNLDCEIPAIRSSGVIAMDAACLADLLLNSSRAQQYNKFCLGRTDEIVYFDDFDTNSVTKVVRTKSKHPLIPKPLEFVTLIHARKLKPEDNQGEGFLFVSRGVTLSNEKEDPTAPRILLNVNLIKTITGVEGKCELINMNHVNSPMTPSFLVKKLGSDGAVSFFSELRALCR